MTEQRSSSPKEGEASESKPRSSPPYTGSILPQSMPSEEEYDTAEPIFAAPQAVHYDDRGVHSPYDYQQGYTMYPPSHPPYQDPTNPGILPSSSPPFTSAGQADFSVLPPMDTPLYNPSPVYGYGASGQGYSASAAAYQQDPYAHQHYGASASAAMGSAPPGSRSAYAAASLTPDSSYAMGGYSSGMPSYPAYPSYSQQYQNSQPSRRYEFSGGVGERVGGGGNFRRPSGGSYAKQPGPPIVEPGSAKGPEGANLFIFHIPNDFSNQEMYALFAQFGKVLSARIMVESDTGRSRGFGFVSYDSARSAADAISHLNGYSVSERCDQFVVSVLYVAIDQACSPFAVSF